MSGRRWQTTHIFNDFFCHKKDIFGSGRLRYCVQNENIFKFSYRRISVTPSFCEFFSLFFFVLFIQMADIIRESVGGVPALITTISCAWLQAYSPGVFGLEVHYSKVFVFEATFFFYSDTTRSLYQRYTVTSGLLSFTSIFFMYNQTTQNVHPWCFVNRVFPPPHPPATRKVIQTYRYGVWKTKSLLQ